MNQKELQTVINLITLSNSLSYGQAYIMQMHKLRQCISYANA